MADPRRVDGELGDRLREHFSDAQILQLSLEVSAWNYQKVLVALAMDRPISEEGLTAMTIGPDGTMQFGGLIANANTNA
jgi:hypothetical protein